jgi:alpha-tubulin suppressor-like RCC1 family protein
VAAVGGTLGCGSDVSSPTLSARPSATSALTLGSLFSCALTVDAKPFCWGGNLSGQLGDSSFVSKLVPGPVIGGHSFVAISGSVGTACALERSGAVWWWGDDPTQPGQALTFRTQPLAIPVGRSLVSLSVGRKSACGLDSDGAAYCWGENGRGQLGVGDTLPHSKPARVLGGIRFTAISAGFWTTCALSTTGSIYCWGDNAYGELGTGDTIPSSKPRQVASTIVFRSVTTGSLHACGISATGTALCWGSNFSGQVGHGTTERRLSPTPVAPGLTFTMLRAGRANSIFTHTCGVTPTGDVYCWGWNSKGQLGNAGTNAPCIAITPPGVNPGTGVVPPQCTYAAVKAAGVSNVVALDTGQEHTCVLTSSAAVFCWGDNAYGQLGDGTGVASAAPVQVKGGLSFP